MKILSRDMWGCISICDRASLFIIILKKQSSFYYMVKFSDTVENFLLLNVNSQS